MPRKRGSRGTATMATIALFAGHNATPANVTRKVRFSNRFGKAEGHFVGTFASCWLRRFDARICAIVINVARLSGIFERGNNCIWDRRALNLCSSVETRRSSSTASSIVRLPLRYPTRLLSLVRLRPERKKERRGMSRDNLLPTNFAGEKSLVANLIWVWWKFEAFGEIGLWDVEKLFKRLIISFTAWKRTESPKMTR